MEGVSFDFSEEAMMFTAQDFSSFPCLSLGSSRNVSKKSEAVIALGGSQTQIWVTLLACIIKLTIS